MQVVVDDSLDTCLAPMGKARGGRLASRSLGNAVQVDGHGKAAIQASATRLSFAISMADTYDVSTLLGGGKMVARRKQILSNIREESEYMQVSVKAS